MSDLHDPVPYRELTDEAFGIDAAQTFTVREAGRGTLVLRGTCPRCRAAVEVTIVDHLVSRSGPLGKGDAESGGNAGRGTPVRCVCQLEHADRPDGLDGCGAYWNLTIETQP